MWDIEICQRGGINRPLPDISYFLENAEKVVDDPINYLDPVIMGLVHFACQQGLIDELPYDLLVEIGCDRESVEEIGSDANNNIKLLVDAAIISAPQQLAV